MDFSLSFLIKSKFEEMNFQTNSWVRGRGAWRVAHFILLTQKYMAINSTIPASGQINNKLSKIHASKNRVRLVLKPISRDRDKIDKNK